MDILVSARNKIMRKGYEWILKPVFFRIDPETIHDAMSFFLKALGTNAFTRKLAYLAWGYRHKILEQNVCGIRFENPVGLSAGFDKNGELIKIIPSLGFGFLEIGSITGMPCSGNPKPRLWRLKKSKSLVVYYGLKNDGCEVIAKRLRGKKFQTRIGISIAKTNCKETVDTEKGIEDYFKAYTAFEGIGDYATINISCPNAFGGQPFTDAYKLDLLLKKIMSAPKTKPVFLKLSPDLTTKEVDDIITVTEKYSIDGFVCTNLTKNRNSENIADDSIPEKGGLSGKIVGELSDRMIRYIYKKTGGKYVIIGVGGIFTAEDAYRKIKAGASLLELITGMIYQGPQTLSDINMGLVDLLKKDGYKSIREAVGKSA